jgi:hypothetical protein
MVSSQSVNTPGVDLIEHRDMLYFSNYEYRLRLNVPNVYYVWYCKKVEDLDNRINGKCPTWAKIPITKKQSVIEHRDALVSIINLILEKKKAKNFATRIEGDTLAVFSNDLSFLNNVANSIGTNYREDITQATTSAFAGVKTFVKEPKHKFRVYFKSRRVDENFQVEFRDFLSRNKTLYASPALKKWAMTKSHRYGPWYFRWISSMWFIDYDDESTLSYLALMYPELLGKKYKLEKRPDNT